MQIIQFAFNPSEGCWKYKKLFENNFRKIGKCIQYLANREIKLINILYQIIQQENEESKQRHFFKNLKGFVNAKQRTLWV